MRDPFKGDLDLTPVVGDEFWEKSVTFASPSLRNVSSAALYYKLCVDEFFGVKHKIFGPIYSEIDVEIRKDFGESVYIELGENEKEMVKKLLPYIFLIMESLITTQYMVMKKIRNASTTVEIAYVLDTSKNVLKKEFFGAEYTPTKVDEIEFLGELKSRKGLNELHIANIIASMIRDKVHDENERRMLVAVGGEVINPREYSIDTNVIKEIFDAIMTEIEDEYEDV